MVLIKRLGKVADVFRDDGYATRRRSEQKNCSLERGNARHLLCRPAVLGARTNGHSRRTSRISAKTRSTRRNPQGTRSLAIRLGGPVNLARGETQYGQGSTAPAHPHPPSGCLSKCTFEGDLLFRIIRYIAYGPNSLPVGAAPLSSLLQPLPA
jgi:hypothetical protein